MKLYVLMIFRLSDRLEKTIEAMDKKIERIAYDPFGDTVKQYEKILEISDVRTRLINLKVMYELMIRNLGGDETLLIARHALGLSAGEIAESLNVNAGTVYKRLCRAMRHAEKVLKSAGFDEKRMERDYADVPQVTAAMNMMKRRVRPSGRPKICVGQKPVA